MTIQEAYNKIFSSEELKKKALDALKNGNVDEFLKENNIDLTFEQIKEYTQKIKTGELSKTELNMAAGGGCSDCGDIVWSTLTIGLGCAVSIGVSENLSCW